MVILETNSSKLAWKFNMKKVVI